MDTLRQLALFATVAVLSLAGCGGDGSAEERPGMPPDDTTAGGNDTGPVRVSGDDAATATVGPAGGVLELSNGARLEIPEGALGSPTEVVFGRGAQTQAFSNREGERTIGPTLLVQPALVAQPGTRFGISAPFAMLPDGYSEEDVALATEEVDQMEQQSDVRGTQATRWQYNPARIDGQRIEAEIGALAGMRVQFLLSR